MKQNKQTNKYQITTILTLLATVMYGVAYYKTYHSFAANREKRLWLYGIIGAAWLSIAIANFVMYRKAKKEENKEE